MAGVAITTIAKLMGHRTIQRTMRYAHLSREHHQSAVDRMLLSAEHGTKADTTPNGSAEQTTSHW